MSSDEDLPDQYAQGAFDWHRKMPVVMRFSTTPGDVLDDKVSTPRGLALKLIGVDGERLPGREGDIPQGLRDGQCARLHFHYAEGISIQSEAAREDDRQGSAREGSVVSGTARRESGDRKTRRRERDAKGSGRTPGKAYSRREFVHGGAIALWTIFRKAECSAGIA